MQITGYKGGDGKLEPRVEIVLTPDEAHELYVRLHEVPGDHFAEDLAFDLHAARINATATTSD